VDAAGFAAPNRLAFLADCLRDLDAGLRERGGRLVVRHGDIVDEVCKVAAEADADEVHMASDVSAHAHLREERLRGALEAEGVRLHVHDTVTTAVAPGSVVPATSDHFAVFTPYFRRWSQERLRDPLAAPGTVRVPAGVGSELLPSRDDLSGLSEGLAAGGESEGRKRLTVWLRAGVTAYEDRHDDLAGDATSRLSPHLHFGTLSPVELVHRSRRAGGPGAEAFVRQLAWRDFNRQVLAARPAAAGADYRTRHDRWRSERDAAEDIEAWKEGRTGYPIVDAAMRQLRHEGWMHNRARLVAGSFLTKDLGIDWRWGERHFMRLLIDGDEANNNGNWQWIASVGTDPQPAFRRIYNPARQMERHDPDGAYVRRYVPELRDVPDRYLAEPWRMPEAEQRACGCMIGRDYPEPIVDHAEARRAALARYAAR
jgi:deoxyribodipyrimidine photo-lyase